MTVKEAILKSLEDKQIPATTRAIYEHIVGKNYYAFTRGETPEMTVAARLGDFIRNGDRRVKRSKDKGGAYVYYLTENAENNEQLLSAESVVTPTAVIENPKVFKFEGYTERDLHKLLSSFLKATGIYSKTIYHEQSSRIDEHQKWIHPDMVGIKFLNLQTNASQLFFKAINKVDTFKMFAYEIKKEINSDYELKKSFFQAVSNSSWANFGYLVAFEISDSLNDEMERLNQSFGIGIIELRANPYESKILFPAKEKAFDFKTIDKLCKINKDFERFIEQTEKLMTANEKYQKATEKELEEFCDKYFLNDTEFEKYCTDKNIPTE